MTTNEVNSVLKFIAPTLRYHLEKLCANIWDNAQEIRLSMGKPLIICFNKDHIKLPVICDESSVKETLLLLTDNSVYSVNDKLNNGFLTIEGGHRVGICGTAVMNNGSISAIRNISSINIRIKREITGAADRIIPYIKTENGICNTIIISPPKCGKTTLLRDIARVLGNYHNVSIVDERSEIAGMYAGTPQNDVGVQTTVFDGCIKSVAIPIVIRSMSPEIVITDEIGSEEDMEAINYALKSGVKIITSAHGDTLENIRRKPILKNIIDEFDLIITLTNDVGVGTISNIIYKGTTYG